VNFQLDDRSQFGITDIWLVWTIKDNTQEHQRHQAQRHQLQPHRRLLTMPKVYKVAGRGGSPLIEVLQVSQANAD
jgi:hypothetical protein